MGDQVRFPVGQCSLLKGMSSSCLQIVCRWGRCDQSGGRTAIIRASYYRSTFWRALAGLFTFCLTSDYSFVSFDWFLGVNKHG